MDDAPDQPPEPALHPGEARGPDCRSAPGAPSGSRCRGQPPRGGALHARGMAAARHPLWPGIAACCGDTPPEAWRPARVHSCEASMLTRQAVSDHHDHPRPRSVPRLARPAGEVSAADPLSWRNAGRRHDLSAGLTRRRAFPSACGTGPSRPRRHAERLVREGTGNLGLAPRQILIEPSGAARSTCAGGRCSRPDRRCCGPGQRARLDGWVRDSATAQSGPGSSAQRHGAGGPWASVWCVLGSGGSSAFLIGPEADGRVVGWHGPPPASTWRVTNGYGDHRYRGQLASDPGSLAI